VIQVTHQSSDVSGRYPGCIYNVPDVINETALIIPDAALNRSLLHD